jgi:hypothetical protein
MKYRHRAAIALASQSADRHVVGEINLVLGLNLSLYNVNSATRSLKSFYLLINYISYCRVLRCQYCVLFKQLSSCCHDLVGAPEHCLGVQRALRSYKVAHEVLDCLKATALLFNRMS